MNIYINQQLPPEYDALVIPFTEERTLMTDLPERVLAANLPERTLAAAPCGGTGAEFPEKELVPQRICEAVRAALAAGFLAGACGSVYSLNLYGDGHFVKVVMVSLGDGGNTNREIFLALAKAFKCCREAKAAVTAVLLDNAPEIFDCPDLRRKAFELPFLVSYQFLAYKSKPADNGMRETVFVTGREGLEAELIEARNVAESTMMARDLVNHPSKFLTPEGLAGKAVEIAKECGLEAVVYDRDGAKALGMGAFLAVARGAATEPRVIVLRYRGGARKEPPVALIGKGVMFDSGGYSLKSKMATMHDDMGGAAAVLGAVRAIAKQKLPINVTVVITACENMVSGDAFVPGDILYSMNGKTIEMLNADAEGRLTLADAITYAVRNEGAGRIIDIATLTGAAKGAVGGRSAAVVTNDEELFEEIQEASRVSCEKVWRLPADAELMEVLKSEVADIKNSNPGNTMGGGSIVAGLFLQEFTEGRPWLHVDMAPVNWLAEGNSYCTKGGTGYGVSLLYEMGKIMGI